jgi:hypothetical protein
MDPNIHLYKEAILNQVREDYGKLVYSYTTHIKCAHIVQKRNNILKWVLIFISAISTGGLIAILCNADSKALEIATACLTTISLALNSYQKSASLENQIVAHIQTSNELWKLREDYLSFMTDFDAINEKEIIIKRDFLIQKLGDIYSHEPLTNSKAYKNAKASLMKEEEQFFTDEEINKMLPKHLRI